MGPVLLLPAKPGARSWGSDEAERGRAVTPPRLVIGGRVRAALHHLMGLTTRGSGGGERRLRRGRKGGRGDVIIKTASCLASIIIKMVEMIRADRMDGLDWETTIRTRGQDLEVDPNINPDSRLRSL